MQLEGKAEVGWVGDSWTEATLSRSPHLESCLLGLVFHRQQMAAFDPAFPHRVVVVSSWLTFSAASISQPQPCTAILGS